MLKDVEVVQYLWTNEDSIAQRWGPHLRHTDLVAFVAFACNAWETNIDFRWSAVDFETRGLLRSPRNAEVSCD